MGDGAAVALLLALVALFFWRLYAPNPADRVAFPIGDFTDQYFPLRHFVAASLAQGQFPFWNPFLFGGQPGLADPQAAVLYPPALLNALLWGANFSLLALELEAVAHIALAAVGSFLFVRVALRLGTLPALVGAIVFAFGGFLTGFPLEQITILESTAWLPWLLLGIHGASGRAAPARRLLWGALAAVTLALALLAGHPQSALYLLYLSLAYSVFRLLAGRGEGRARWLLLALFPLGIGLAAAQLVPTLRFIADSSRQALDYNFVRGGLSWEELTLLFLPKVVGSTPLYVGIATLLLAPLGLLSDGQRGEKRFWGGSALFSLLLAFGGNSFLFDLLYLGLPGFEQVRSQERVLLLWGWSLALLAAWGMATLLAASRDGAARALVRRYTRWIARFLPILLLPWLALWVIRALSISQITLKLEVLDAFFTRYSFFLLLVVLGWALLHAAGRAPRRAVGALLLALLVWDLFTINRAPHLGPPVTEALAPRTEVVEALGAWQAEAPARVEVVGQPLPRSNDGMRWGFPLLSGNEPLRLDFVERFGARAQPWNRLQAFGAQYIVADRPLNEDDASAYELLAASDSPVPSYLIRVRPPMPYAWLVGQSESFASADAIYENLANTFRDLHSVALLEAPLALSGDTFPPGEQVTVERRGPAARLRVQNPAARPTLLLIAEPATAGWQATLDGAPVPWLRANGVNVSVPIPPGEHVVTLRYVAPGWALGRAISAASVLALLGLLLGSRWVGRR